MKVMKIVCVCVAFDSLNIYLLILCVSLKSSLCNGDCIALLKGTPLCFEKN